MEFKDKLRVLRIEKNLSQQQLADDLFMSRSMIAKYETGVALPTIKTVETFAEYFNVEISSLMDCHNEIGMPYSYFRLFMVFHNVVYWIEMIIYFSFTVLSFLPIFNGQSIIIGSKKNHSVMVLVALVYSVLCIIVLLIWKYAFKTTKQKMLISIFTDFSFLVGSFLIFVAAIIGVGGTQM